jgi:hypothetical protein
MVIVLNLLACALFIVGAIKFKKVRTLYFVNAALHLALAIFSIASEVGHTNLSEICITIALVSLACCIFTFNNR